MKLKGWGSNVEEFSKLGLAETNSKNAPGAEKVLFIDSATLDRPPVKVDFGLVLRGSADDVCTTTGILWPDGPRSGLDGRPQGRFMVQVFNDIRLRAAMWSGALWYAGQMAVRSVFKSSRPTGDGPCVMRVWRGSSLYSISCAFSRSGRKA